jgi:NAD(P)-dependent dehydrogenase (short-subunit alcohol dehydrogenase family)
MDVGGCSILVTGAASGLGAACARELHGAGARILAIDMSESSETGLGHDIEFIRADVTQTADVARAVQCAVDRFGRLDAAISCAGILAAARLVGREQPHDLDLFRRVIEVNLTGTFNVMRLAAQQMRRNSPNADGERGVIINTASVSAFEGQMGQTAYAASKGGIVSMCLPAARDLASDGIRVVAIAPGVFQTPMVDSAPEKVRQSLVEQTEFPARFGQPREFAMLVRQVLENPMLNGCTVRLDGAVRMGAK